MKETSHPTEPPPTRGSWRAGETISFGGLSDKATGHMGYSERVGPSVLVLHEENGLGPGIKAYVDRLAQEGFTALAPDLYGGRFTTEPDEVAALSRSLTDDDSLKPIRAAATHLTENWHPRLGVVGFSMGARLGTRYAGEVARDATVVYYGYDPGALSAERWTGPLLGHFAGGAGERRRGGLGRTAGRGWEEADATFRLLEQAGRDVEWYRYEGAQHSFANPDLAGALDSGASEVAWERTIEHLYYHLS